VDTVVNNEDLAKIEELLERAELELAGFEVLKEHIDGMREALDALEAAVKRESND